jgi:hypothetical protein
MTMAKKLGVRDGETVALAKAPAAVKAAFGASAATRVTKSTKALVTFVESARDVDAAAKSAMSAGDAGVAVWFAYPKGRKDADISRDKGWDALSSKGWVPVSLFSIDDHWSCLRFKHDPKLQKERVKRGTMTNRKS